MFLAAAVRYPATRAALSEGSSIASRIEMMAITTSNSINVKAIRFIRTIFQIKWFYFYEITQHVSARPMRAREHNEVIDGKPANKPKSRLTRVKTGRGGKRRFVAGAAHACALPNCCGTGEVRLTVWAEREERWMRRGRNVAVVSARRSAERREMHREK